MTKFYKDYTWKEGAPYGIQPLDLPEEVENSYKVVSDPYGKWRSVELYLWGKFNKIIYDSQLLNFRKLHPSEQIGWERELIAETEESSKYLIRNQDDRVVLLEEQFFQNGDCVTCMISSPHGTLLSVHRMFYEVRGDAFNGVILCDANDRPVMQKKYTVDECSGQFMDLLEECWNEKKIEVLT